MYEHRRKSPLSRIDFFIRILLHAFIALGVVAAALGIGILGYHRFEGLPWLDATLNASMILGGMGPVLNLYTTYGKLFASAFALFSGVVLIGVTGIILAAPVGSVIK